MKIIIPMAGMGKRMRPHTLTVPKPLIPVAGKPIVYRLVEDLAAMVNEQIDEIAFIIGDFGAEVEQNLIKIAESVGAKGTIHYQDKPLGTAHAILCAGDSLDGHVIVAFADTLFYADFKIDTTQDGVIWTKRIPNPQQFGVVETSTDGSVVKFWEKPQHFVSDEAIIGIYYFSDGADLRSHLQRLIDENIMVKGEYQLTDALEAMLQQGKTFKTATVTHWLDCGNKDATVDTNKTVLELTGNKGQERENLFQDNAVIVEPCYIGYNVILKNCIIGPYASIGHNSMVENAIITNSIVLNNSKVTHAFLDNAMLGNYSSYYGQASSVNLGDYSEVK